MRKAITIILLTATLLTMLSACMNGNARKNENQTSSNNNSSVTESKANESSTSFQNKKLNLDLISDIGLTYTQILKKRGSLVKVVRYGGGLSYSFNDGYGGYHWGYENLDYGQEVKPGEAFPIANDGTGSVIVEKAPLPKEHIKCFYVQTTPKYLFLGMENSSTISEIKEVYGIKDISTQSANGYDGWEYVSSFQYESINVVIYTHEKENFDLNAQVVLRSN